MNQDLNINLNAESIKAYLKLASVKLRNYSVHLFALFVLLICGFLVWQINNFGNIQPSDEQVLEEKQIIKRPQIDEESITKIEQLEDQNIAVQSLFKSARDNPFED